MIQKLKFILQLVRIIHKLLKLTYFFDIKTRMLKKNNKRSLEDS